MRTKILLLFLLGCVGMVSAQKETPKLHYDLSFDKDTIRVSDLLAKKSQIIQIDVTGKYFSNGIKQIKILKKQNELSENEATLNFSQKDISRIKIDSSDIKFKESLYLSIKLDSLRKTDKKIVYGIVGLGKSGEEINNNTGNLQQIVIIIKKANEIKKTEIDNAKDTNVYMYFGENKVLKEDIFKNKNDEASQILRSVINNKGKESYFGDIIVPKHKEEFYFYKYIERKDIKKIKEEFKKEQHNFNKSKDSTNIKEFLKTNKFMVEKKYDCGDYILQPKLMYKFKKLDVEIKDGYFCDIRVFVEDDEGNEHVFTNQIGISVLFFSSFGTRKMMNYKNSIRKVSYDAYKEYTDEKMKYLFISLSDVMNYNYKVGNHYIPHDIALELPTKPEENQTGNAVYQIKQETYLEKILELRAYTDFLTLFGDSQNGVAQVEGRAKFYLFPYPFRFLGSKKTLGQIEYFPAVSPSVNYSRFEKDSRYVQTKLDSTNTNYVVKNDIDLV
ncbi:hypothetical protein [Chryseobacterium scophthalmum]|uniref:DUF3857 domain-containing protein n=1 Tax=Chryseobacterium scophthalmum TaxID=59733 RepID=A0A1N6IIW7_9FLAO|nr:hypothetical protein [Chryseobacterium scophthalmum]SIO31974.1 hypothetical protein SAMN05421769_3425 [Chryseobacterium scophthalmum]